MTQTDYEILQAKCDMYKTKINLIRKERENYRLKIEKLHQEETNTIKIMIEIIKKYSIEEENKKKMVP